MVEASTVRLGILCLTFICLANINSADGSRTLRVLVTKTESDTQMKWTNYLKQLEERAELSFQVFATRFKYSSDKFLQLCKDKSYDLCLVMKSAASAQLLSEDVQLLSPAFVFATPGGVQSNFTHVFHSSVWAFLLLAVLLSIGLLAGVELLHPFGYRMHRFWNYEQTAKLNVTESVLHILGGLFFKTPSKRPASPAGNILVVFWAAFCLCIASLFIAGTTASVFASPRTSGLWLSALPRGAVPPASCPASDLFCALVRRMDCPSGPQSRTCHLLQDARTAADSAEDLWRRVASGRQGLLTDSLAASQLLQRSSNLSAVLLGPPIASLALHAWNASLLPALNRGVLAIRERGGLLDTGSAPGRSGGPLLDQLAAALPIRLPMVAGVFVLLLLGGAAVLVALGAEFAIRTFVSKDHEKLDSEDAQSIIPSETRV